MNGFLKQIPGEKLEDRGLLIVSVKLRYSEKTDNTH